MSLKAVRCWLLFNVAVCMCILEGGTQELDVPRPSPPWHCVACHILLRHQFQGAKSCLMDSRAHSRSRRRSCCSRSWSAHAVRYVVGHRLQRLAARRHLRSRPRGCHPVLAHVPLAHGGLRSRWSVPPARAEVCPAPEGLMTMLALLWTQSTCGSLAVGQHPCTFNLLSLPPCLLLLL